MAKKPMNAEKRAKINQLIKAGFGISNDKPGGFIFLTAPGGRMFDEYELEEAIQWAAKKEVQNG